MLCILIVSWISQILLVRYFSTSLLFALLIELFFIAKQNKEIDKITSDIRDLQKTINLSSNTLSRADAITEELIFKAASDKNDPVMVDIYRKLKQLRSSFESLVGTVSNIGATEKNARDLETKIEQERNRVSAQNFERIQNDLQAISQENQSILAEVKKLAGNK